MGRKCRPVFRFAICCFAAALAFAPSAALSAEYFASSDGTGAGSSREDPCSITDGKTKLSNDLSGTLTLLKGTYKLDKAIALNGSTAKGVFTTIRGETGDPADVILDMQGKCEAIRINQNFLVTGLTVTNGSNKSFSTASQYSNRASGIRVGYFSATEGTLSVVSNCVVTCCTNAFTSQTQPNGTEVHGGAVCVCKNGLLVDSTVSGNVATTYRSAGVVVYGGEVRMCTISGNMAPTGGGGVYVERGTPSALVADCVISGNATDSSHGGGGIACFDSGASLTLTNCTITGNTARYGAGVDCWGGTTLKCIDCRIENNEAEYYGGGMRVTGTCNAEISGSVFDGNKATNSGTSNTFGGGGVAVSAQTAGASLVVSNCVFRNNQAGLRGGAFGGQWPSVVYADLVDCVFTNNSAYLRGGAVCVYDTDETDTATRFRMRNCLVARNKTTNNNNGNNKKGEYGGGVYLNAKANPVLDSCTIVSNTTTHAPVESSNIASLGAGLYHSGSGTATNCIIAFNLVNGKQETASGWCRDADAYRNCCVWPALASVFLEDEEHKCVNKDPMFKDADAGDYTLRQGSPCRDAGIFEDWMEGAFDLAGNARVAGNGVDIGCYEYLPPRGLRIVLR